MQQRKSREKFLKFFSLIKYNKKHYFVYFIQAFIRGFHPLIHVIFIERIVFYISNSNIELLQKTLMYYLFVLIFYEFLWFMTRKFWWVVTIPEWIKNIYDIYLKQYIKMNNNSVEKIWVWKIISILENWRLRWTEWLADSVERWISLFILLLYVFFITFSHWFFYTLWFFILLIFSVSILIVVNNYQFKFRSQRSEIRNNMLKLITKVLMSKNEILQTNRINSEIKKIWKHCDEMSYLNIKMSNWRTIQNRAIPFVVSISLFLFIYIFWAKIISGDILISEFVAIISVFLVINSSLFNFIVFYVNLTKDFIDIEKLWDFFDENKPLEWYDTWENFVYKKWEIHLKNISYWYEENKLVFNDFSLDVNWWKITAFVWNSWSWKTTLVKLISWYIKVNSGNIIIDWQDLWDVSLKSFYKNIWYLSQEPSVFDWTILENLTYSVDFEVSNEELDKVIKLSQCEFIYDLKDWVKTQIWEKWIRLSWWQRQRLAIAKIMLKNPKIIILDEPTSALDSFSEEKITKALNNLFLNKTVIVIAHRLQTVKHADEIIVLENWEIKERWNHKELLSKKWVYKKMLDLQSLF